MTRLEAEKALLKGELITNDNYFPEEYLFMVKDYIYDEHRYNCGTLQSDFWTKHQRNDGWKIIEKR